MMKKSKSSILIVGVAWLALHVAAAAQTLNGAHPADAINALQMAPLPPNSSPAVNQSLWSKKRIQAYQRSLQEYTGTPLALLRIPKLQLEVPVMEGTDEVTLDRGAGHIAGTALLGRTGNIGIAGHRDGFFRCLKDIHKGDAIELVMGQRTETYIVNEIHVISRHNPKDLQPSTRSQLTLVTCHPFYFVGSAPNRFIVHASLKKHSADGGAGMSARGK